MFRVSYFLDYVLFLCRTGQLMQFYPTTSFPFASPYCASSNLLFCFFSVEDSVALLSGFSSICCSDPCLCMNNNSSPASKLKQLFRTGVCLHWRWIKICHWIEMLHLTSKKPKRRKTAVSDWVYHIIERKWCETFCLGWRFVSIICSTSFVTLHIILWIFCWWTFLW